MTEETKDKILASLSYLTWGIWGIVMLLLKKVESSFLKYHVYQSLILGVLFIFFNFGLGLLTNFSSIILSFIPIIGPSITVVLVFLQQIVLFAEWILILYAIWGVIKYEQTYIKWVSEQVKSMN